MQLDPVGISALINQKLGKRLEVGFGKRRGSMGKKGDDVI